MNSSSISTSPVFAKSNLAIMMNWSDLFAGLALYLVIEGIMPFLNPPALRRAMSAFIQLNDAQLRIAGLISMVLGVGVLYFVRGQ